MKNKHLLSNIFSNGKILLIFFLSIILLNNNLHSENKTELSSLQILEKTRHPYLIPGSGTFEGIAYSKKYGGKTQKFNILANAKFSSSQMAIKLVFNDEEAYMVSQNFDDGMAGTTQIQLQKTKKNKTSLADIGIRPSDLTFSCLHWNFKEQLKNDSVRGRSCFVFRLQHPETEEYIKACIDSKYFSPVKIQWFKNENEKKYYRELTLTDFEKINGIYIVKEFVVKNPGWKTKIKFENCAITLDENKK
ncbi:MAG: outer membrane lipoprotein-sorting protein [Verrucomicrobiota bacterium]|nr:outer membrane lipoprotein-sorting protein [Verrucomicrobiota bacterium]